MTSIAVPPLPVTRFAELKEFYERDRIPELWICGEESHSWTWEDAGRVAANLYFELGEPPIIAGLEGDDALQRWLAIFGTPHWRDLSQKMIAVPGVAGDGPRSLSPRSANIRRANIRRLNAWCLHWLTAFYAHVGQARAAAPADPTPEAGQAPSGRGNAAYDDRALVARAGELLPTLRRQSKRGAAKAAVEEVIEQNPGTIKEGERQTTIDRIRRKI